MMAGRLATPALVCVGRVRLRERRSRVASCLVVVTLFGRFNMIGSNSMLYSGGAADAEVEASMLHGGLGGEEVDASSSRSERNDAAPDAAEPVGFSTVDHGTFYEPMEFTSSSPEHGRALSSCATICFAGGATACCPRCGYCCSTCGVSTECSSKSPLAFEELTVALDSHVDIARAPSSSPA